jgi:hypothetical protein
MENRLGEDSGCTSVSMSGGAKKSSRTCAAVVGAKVWELPERNHGLKYSTPVKVKASTMAYTVRTAMRASGESFRGPPARRNDYLVRFDITYPSLGFLHQFLLISDSKIRVSRHDFRQCLWRAIPEALPWKAGLSVL